MQPIVLWASTPTLRARHQTPTKKDTTKPLPKTRHHHWQQAKGLHREKEINMPSTHPKKHQTRQHKQPSNTTHEAPPPIGTTSITPPSQKTTYPPATPPSPSGIKNSLELPTTTPSARTHSPPLNQPTKTSSPLATSPILNLGAKRPRLSSAE